MVRSAVNKQHPHAATEEPEMNEQNARAAAVNALGGFIKKNAVMCIAFIAAAITCFIVPIDGEYAAYFDCKTLTCLFCVLAVVCALRNIRFFYILAEKIVRLFGNARSCITALVYITFIGSMLIANDMALLTFLPLGYRILEATGKQKYMAFTFIMQNIAANLGGMLTPFGNPQNLYIYTRYSIPDSEFMQIMAPPFLLSVVMITICCLVFVKPERLSPQGGQEALPKARTALYLLLFALSIIIVFRIIPYWLGLIVIPAALLVCDRKALKDVDYGLLMTFVFFFVFAGNMSRIEAVRTAISGVLGRNTLLCSVVSCQFISNVPSAILLSRFTDNYPQLLVGVNIGGVGTIISSLASLITFREYSKHAPGRSGYYLKVFSAFNFAFLFILTAFMLPLGRF